MYITGYDGPLQFTMMHGNPDASDVISLPAESSPDSNVGKYIKTVLKLIQISNVINKLCFI